MKKIKLNKKIIDIINSSKFPYENKKDNKSISRWMVILSSVIQQYKIISYSGANKYKQGNEDDPFVFLITPFVKVACIELLSSKGVFYASLNDQCRQDIENQLVKKLVYICSYTILTDFKESQKLSNPVDVDVTEYVKKIYKNPLVFFKKYSVLARLLAMHTDYWIQSTFKMLKRLLTDYEQLNQKFFDEKDNVCHEDVIKSITEFQLNLSDPHEHGQTVAIISFNHGNKVVYKPKNMYAEYAFSEFIDWFNEQVGSMELKLNSVCVINKHTYGWSRFIPHVSCETDKNVEEFYKKIGMFGAIFYILRGSDYHYDNLIAHANDPVFIDHEMLFYPLFIDRHNEEFKDKTIFEVQNNYYESVVGTRLFPIIEERRSGKIGDISAVGHFNANNINMALPFKNREYQRVFKYKDMVVNGFEYAYKLMQKNKEYLQTERSPLHRFKELDVRFNMRSTSTYLRIIYSTIVPAALRNGIVYIDYIHRLRDQFPSVFSNGLPREIANQELMILSRLDAPRFTVNCTARGLNKLDKTRFEEIFELSGYELVLHRIKTLDDDALIEQKSYLIQSLNETGGAD
ncbi:MAG: DUF4135 domain-containing protein [Pseudomonadota bacterium]